MLNNGWRRTNQLTQEEEELFLYLSLLFWNPKAGVKNTNKKLRKCDD